jgi:hypothetical protein
VNRFLPAFLVLFTALVAADETRVPTPSISKGEGEQCVEATDVMRREHMNFLMHQRDATVHQGVRTTRHSLVGCIDCHVQQDARGKAIPVNAPGQFCDSCHQYAAVSLDCFECHATTPDSASASVSANPHGATAATSTASLAVWQQWKFHQAAASAIP